MTDYSCDLIRLMTNYMSPCHARKLLSILCQIVRPRDMHYVKLSVPVTCTLCQTVRPRDIADAYVKLSVPLKKCAKTVLKREPSPISLFYQHNPLNA